MGVTARPKQHFAGLEKRSEPTCMAAKDGACLSEASVIIINVTIDDRIIKLTQRMVSLYFQELLPFHGRLTQSLEIAV